MRGRGRQKLVEGVLIVREAPVLSDLPVTPVNYLTRIDVQRFSRTGRGDFEKSDRMFVGAEKVVILYLHGAIAQFTEFIEETEHRFSTLVFSG